MSGVLSSPSGGGVGDADVSRCPFCGATSVEAVLRADDSLPDLDTFLCTTCSNRWCTRPAVPSACRDLCF